MSYFYLELKNRIELRVTVDKTDTAAVTVEITPPVLPEVRPLTLAQCADLWNEHERARFREELTAGLTMLASSAQLKDIYAEILNQVNQQSLI